MLTLISVQIENYKYLKFAWQAFKKILILWD